MDVIVDAGWRVYPALGLMALGVTLAARATRLGRSAWRRPLTGSMQPLTWMRAFRLAMIGLALAGVGVAWLWHLGWLLALSLAVGGEETLESSIAIHALRRASPLPAKRRADDARPLASPPFVARVACSTVD